MKITIPPGIEFEISADEVCQLHKGAGIKVKDLVDGVVAMIESHKPEKSDK